MYRGSYQNIRLETGLQLEFERNFFNFGAYEKFFAINCKYSEILKKSTTYLKGKGYLFSKFLKD